MSYTPGPLPEPYTEQVIEYSGIAVNRTDTFPLFTAEQVQAHTAAEVARAVAAERERWPTTSDDVRGFVGSDYCALKYGREDQCPCDEDIYTMSAHDILSAIQNWRMFVLGHSDVLQGNSG